ncbi:hypothetical protein F2P81_013450 [Scophthalmus maximus]|uniref:C2 domain-containing protein n=1 Tax=Scophthalmus maximus TaxID=52904 RepID=A0A6A4SQT8_SCOMX|nr:hypothetical protein F2P81_013450 [Scophthalmus maximus]
MDANGLSDPYVKFRMGHQKYKSKTIPKTLGPQWREQFDFHLYEEQGGHVDITVWDKDAGKKDDFMGRCTIDLSLLSKERTYKLHLPLEQGEGVLVLLVTLTASAAVSISDLSINMLDDPNERHQIMQRYSLWRSFYNLKDVGVVQSVKLITNRQIHFEAVDGSNVKDIHSVLEVTVYDEDRDRSADFLGKVAIPLLNIQNGERKAYALKSKELTGPTKGVIFLEIDVIFNAVKAGLRTLIPIEQKYIEEEPRVSKQLLLHNFNRVRRCIMFLINTGCYINSCFEWDSPQRSICAFVLFVIVVWNFELYMIPLALLLPLAWNYILIASGKDTRQDVLFVIVVWNFELYMIPLALLLPLAWNYILIASGKDTRQDVYVSWYVGASELHQLPFHRLCTTEAHSCRLLVTRFLCRKLSSLFSHGASVCERTRNDGQMNV